MSKNYLSQEEVEEMHRVLENHVQAKGYNRVQVGALLSSIFVGTMEMYGWSQDFMDRTCDRMKDKFREKRNNNLGSAPIDRD